MGEKRGLKALQAWCRKVTEGYKNVSVTDMSMSWRDGLAFCAIIHHFRPDLVDFDSLTKDDILLNNRLAFTVAEQSLGIPALLDAEDMVRYSEPDKLSIATYVSQYYQFFEGRNRGTASNNLHTNKLSMKRPFADRTFAPQALPAKIPGVAPRGFFKDDKCSVCSNRVFILERLMVGAKLYHRTCFVCYKCETVLRPGAYAASDDEGKFECIECPRDEKERSPVTEDASIEQSVEIELSSPATTKETDESANIDSESVGNSLKLSNSFINARKKFFETSLDDKSNEKPKEQEEESMKLSINEGLIMKNVSSKEKIQIEPQSSIESKPEEAKAIILEDDDKLDVKETHTDDLTTPVNPISFDFNVKEVSDNIESSKEPPKLPTSNLPTEVEESKTPTNEAPISTALPPPKTPRKTKRLSIDLSSLPTNTEPETSALTSPTRSLSPTTSLPLIAPVTGISSLKRESSSSSLKSISKPGKLVLTPTELTSPERDRKSLDLKGSYQSPLSPGSKWKSSLYDKHEETKDSNRSSLTTEKPKIPDKPLTLTKLPTVPTNEKDAILTKVIDVESKLDSLPKDNQLKCPESSDPFEEEPESPKKEVQIEVKVKPARPPRPVIKETPMIETKPQSKLKVEEYPDDLNPFGDDEEESKEEYPDDLNPFGDEDEPESEPVSTQDKSTDKTSLKSNSTHSLSKIENYDSKLNPFGDSDDEESNLDTLSFSKDSHLSADFSHSSLPSTPRSSSRSSRTMGGRKKKPAPLPPSLLVSGRENHQSDLNISYKSSHSPSRSSLQGSLRGSPSARKKAAPRPPIPPPALASTPKKDVDAVSQDLKAQKEQNNKTMKELAINSPDKNEANTFGYWKKKKRPAPSVPVPPRRQIKMIPVKEIQSELLEIEEKQEDLETQGRDLEMMIREYNQGDESDSPVTVDEEELILQLFELVNQKNILFRRQAELMYIKRSQSLEQEQADIEYKYRIVSSKPEKLKSEADIKKEENLLQRLIEIVELRNEIVESMDMDRQRVQDEDTSIQEQMAQRQGQLQEKLSPDTSVSELVEDAEVKKEKKKHKLKFIKRDKSKDPKEKKPKEPKEKESKVKDPKAKDDSLWKFAKKDKKKATT